MDTLRLNKKDFAIGLWWQVPPGGKSSRKVMLQQARQSASTADVAYNAVVLRPRQFGLGVFAKPRIPHIPSLAALLAMRDNKPFVGVFRLPETTLTVNDSGRYWVCAHTQGMIAGDGDVLCEGLDVAEQLSRDLVMMLGGCDSTITCTTAEETISYLTPLAQKKKADGYLQKLHKPKANRKLMLLALAVILLSIGLFAAQQWMEWREQQAQLAALMQAKLNREKQLADLRAHPEKHFPQPWREAPAPHALAVFCAAQILAQPLFDQGWELDEAICSPQDLTITWAHRPGANFIRLPQHARLASDSAQKAISTIPHTPKLAKKPDDNPLSRADASGHLYQITQDIGARIQIQWGAAQTKEIDGVTLISPWIHGTWSLESIPPALLLDDSLFASLQLALPALRIEQLELRKNAWTAKGSIYAKQ